MTKAEQMFHDLGLTLIRDNSYEKVYHFYNCRFWFNKNDGSFKAEWSEGDGATLGPSLLKAIVEQEKELGFNI